jgi:DNA repair photolyase
MSRRPNRYTPITPPRTEGDTRGRAALPPNLPAIAASPDQKALHGRGAQTNPSGRYESVFRNPFDDGWTLQDDPAPRLLTQAIREAARSVISYNTSPDLSFDRTLNPYRGCEHGCIYCYARPAHAYMGLSPGLDFESQIFIKPEAANLLRKELANPRYTPATLVLGGNTDAYQPLERRYAITRECLHVLSACQHPVALVTKSALVLRDLDILGPMAAKGLAKVAISLTTLDKTLSRKMEPRAAAPHRRLEVIRDLNAAGIPVTVMTAPIIPMLNAHEIERLLEAAAEAGARSAGYVLLRVPLELEVLMQTWLETHYPDRARHVFNLLKDMHGGDVYESAFGVRQKGRGPYAKLIGDRFRLACARLGLNKGSTKLRTDLFIRPHPDASQDPLPKLWDY